MPGEEIYCDCVCEVLQSPRNLIMNIILGIVLTCGLISNAIGIYAKFQILKGNYFRYTVSKRIYLMHNLIYAFSIELDLDQLGSLVHHNTAYLGYS